MYVAIAGDESSDAITVVTTREDLGADLRDLVERALAEKSLQERHLDG